MLTGSILLFSLFVGSAMTATDPRIYTFAIGTAGAPFIAPSPTITQLGFIHDIVYKVCEKAGKTCELISSNDYKLCWNTQKMSSDGLNHRHWDVCAGWYKTEERALVYSFFGEFTAESPAFLYASSTTSFQSYDPETHVTGFREAFWISAACLKRQYNSEVKHVRLYPDWTTLIAAVKNGDIHVAFIELSGVKGVSGLRTLSSQIKCAQTGHAMMVRKEDLPDFAWFETTMKEVAKSPFYKWICNISKMGYGGDPYCL